VRRTQGPQAARNGRAGVSKARKAAAAPGPRPRHPCPEIRAALLQLAATKDGFEGLAAALIEAATAGPMLLMSSGDQGGLDAIGEDRGSAPRRAMQAKRYGDTARLNLNTLTGEMSRAASAFPHIDCWILPTTRPLLGKETETLRSHAHGLGWGFIGLDWSPGLDGTPRLALLCAAYPDVVARWTELAPIAGYLEAIASGPGFDTAAAALKSELVAADIGFVSAQAAALAHLERAYYDPAAARIIAGASPAFLVRAPPVSRAGPRRQILGWYSGDQQALVLLGGEGAGKTWAALDGLRSAAQTEGPLPVVIAAGRAIRHSDALSAVASALSDMGSFAGLSLEDPMRFWRRRLARWGRPGPGRQPAILLLIDGLDEAGAFGWQEWLAPLFTAESSSLFRILLTCRADDWQQGLSLSLADAEEGGVAVATVGNFEPGERDSYLAEHGIEDTDRVAANVLQAALHPRTAFHLVRHALEIGDLTQITREQLLLRDFRNRREIKGGPLTEHAFAELVCRLAVQAQDSALRQQAFRVSEGAVVEQAVDIAGLGRSELRSVLSELVSGHWCSREPGRPNQITFTNQALPDAVGIALAAQVSGLDADSALAEIDRFLEPWGADDLIEPVLRMCATALVVDPTVPDGLCEAVLALWLRRSFHGSAGQDFWRRLHVFRPQVFLDLCAQRAHRTSGWLMEWGLACFWEDYPEHRSLVCERLRAWVSTLPLPPLDEGAEGAYARRVNRDRVRQQARLAALERRRVAGWRPRIGQEEGEAGAQRIHSAMRVIGFLPRVPFVPLLAEWALTMAAAGRVVREDDAAALLRDNDLDHDEAIEAVHAEAASLESGGSALQRAAAAILLRATGRGEDHDRAERLKPSLRPHSATYSPVIPSSAGTLEGNERFNKLRPLWQLSALSDYSAEPAVEPTDSLRDALVAAVGALDNEGLQSLFEREGRALSAALRWVPDVTFQRLREDLRDSAATAPSGSETSDKALLRRALDLLPVLEEGERDRTARAADAVAAGGTVATALRLSHSPLRNQVELLLSTRQDRWPRDYKYLLNGPDEEELERQILALDFSLPRERIWPAIVLVRQLLLRFGPPGPIERPWSRGFEHEDEEVAAAAIEIADLAGGEAASRALVETGWTAAGSANALRAFEGSSLLLKLPDEALRPLLHRLCPETLAYVYLHREVLRNDVGPIWQAWLEQELLVARTSRTFGGNFCRYRDRDEAYALFCRHRPEEALRLITTAWESKALRANIQMDHREGPAWPLLKALAGDHPQLVKRIWRETVEDNGGMWASSVEQIPAELPPGREFDDLRAEMLGRAVTDERLFNAVRQLEASRHLDFLLGYIEAGLSASRAIDQARAVTVAGFLDGSERAVQLWSGRLSATPGSGWLEAVHRKAKTWFDRVLMARHWQRHIAAAPDEAEALRGWWLIARVVDDRYSQYFDKGECRVDRLSWRAQWLDFFHEAAKSLRKDALRPLKESWLHGKRHHDLINGR